MVNILFVASLLFAFLPIFNHPALAMPLLGCLAIGLIFFHQVVLPANIDIFLFPSLAISIKLLTLMIISYLICRWLTNKLSPWLDYHYNITGSKALVSDTSYLIFQMPIMLAYGQSLNVQTTI
jgi:hypothetical protein